MILEIYISAFLIFLTTYGYGLLLKKILINSEKYFLNDNFLVLIYGYFLIIFINLFLNFFISLNHYLTTFLFLSGILAFFFFQKIKKKLIIDISLICLITLTLIYKINLNNDFGLYHAPYLSILSSEKIVFGISNLHFRFGHISAQQYYEILFSNLLLKKVSIIICIALLFSSFLIFSIRKFLDDKISLSTIFLSLISIYFFLRFSRFNEFGNDIIPNLLGLYCLYLSIQIFEKNTIITDYLEFKLLNITLLSIIILFSKLTLIIFLLLPTYLIIRLNFKIKKIFFIKIFFLIILSSLYLTKNVINTGCLFYPVTEKICIQVSWFAKDSSYHAYVEDRAIQSESWSKGWPQRNKIKFKDYTDEFNKNLNWLSSWSKKHFDVVVKNIIIFIFFPSALLFYLIVKFKNEKIIDKTKLLNIIFLCLTTIAGIIFWFIKAPLYRYGFSYIIGFIAMLYSYFFYFYYSNVNLKKYLMYILIFSIIIFSLKNIQRIIKYKKNNVIPDLEYKFYNEKYKVKEFKNLNIRYTEDGVCHFGFPICTNFPNALNQFKVEVINNYKFFILK